MLQYKHIFDTMMGVKNLPNSREVLLLEKSQYYIAKLSKIPGVEMIAIVNSLSMYATHDDSDIDLLIVTQPRMIWLVRFFATMILWLSGVWRHGEDVAGNFCLSFFVTTDALDFSQLSIEDDIYLYYWIYYLKPVFDRDGNYERFLIENGWVGLDEKQKQENRKYTMQDIIFPTGVKKYYWILSIAYYLNSLIRSVLFPKTLRKYRKLGSPEGVIISDDILKFHDRDRRREIRDTILEKYFDK